MKKIIFFFVLILSTTSFASGAAHEADHIPFSQIGWQAANLGILLVAMFFFIRKSIVETFKNRQKDYLDRAEKTKSALKHAEAALAGMKTKLAELEAGESKSLENAKQQAEVLRASLLKEAEASAEKIKTDTALTIKNEVNKAKAEINNEILNQAVNSAKKTLMTGGQSNSNTQEASFVRQLEQVKP